MQAAGLAQLLQAEYGSTLATGWSVDALAAWIHCCSSSALHQGGCGRVKDSWSAAALLSFTASMLSQAFCREGPALQQSKDGEKSKADQRLRMSMVSEKHE